jgi:hypothetical protein
VDHDEESLVEFESALVLFLDDAHRDQVFADIDGYYFAEGFYHCLLHPNTIL